MKMKIVILLIIALNIFAAIVNVMSFIATGSPWSLVFIVLNTACVIFLISTYRDLDY